MKRKMIQKSLNVTCARTPAMENIQVLNLKVFTRSVTDDVSDKVLKVLLKGQKNGFHSRQQSKRMKGARPKPFRFLSWQRQFCARIQSFRTRLFCDSLTISRKNNACLFMICHKFVARRIINLIFWHSTEFFWVFRHGNPICEATNAEI